MQQRVSRVLHWIGGITTRSGTAVVVVALLVVFGLLLAVEGFPSQWEAGFSTLSGAITLVMLLVVQHTQNRNQIVLQLKLDELIRATPQADDLLVHLEVANDAELIEKEQEQISHHDALRESADSENGTS
jgi:low affinity Fe/Cu permease